MRNSLILKILAYFFLFVFGGLAINYLFTVRAADKAMFAQMQQEVAGLATSVAVNLDGAALSRLKPGDETSPQFAAIAARLRGTKAGNPHIKYIYTMRRAENGGIEFIVDGDFGMDPSAARIGQIYEEKLSALERGFSMPAADETFTSDKWGTFLSGYAPVRLPDGEVIGIVGVDMDAREVRLRQMVITKNVFAATVVVMALAALLVFLLARSLTNDINKLTKAANALADGHDCHFTIDRTDEVGRLGDAIKRLSAAANDPAEPS